MKWPSRLIIVRHGQSEYNILRAKKEADPLYQQFKLAFEKNPRSEATIRLAKEVQAKFSLGTSDYGTLLTEEGRRQAMATGRELQKLICPPQVVFASPYLRTRDTFEGMASVWPELKEAKTVFDDRIREQEHGLSLLYNDRRVFETFHPEQKEYREMMGPYWYQYPQGESVSQVRDRIRLFLDMLIRENEGKDVLLITHHLTILSIRANLERLSPEEFLRLDKEEKPVNCGVSTYVGHPNEGANGKLLLGSYNRCLWK